jgi:hypothetical protein
LKGSERLREVELASRRLERLKKLKAVLLKPLQQAEGRLQPLQQ